MTTNIASVLWFAVNEHSVFGTPNSVPGIYTSYRLLSSISSHVKGTSHMSLVADLTIHDGIERVAFSLIRVGVLTSIR